MVSVLQQALNALDLIHQVNSACCSYPNPFAYYPYFSYLFSDVDRHTCCWC
jgi:hypothetical protein